ncbi:MAG: hypothetical protein FWD99_05580 [Oscillospiraceae bacterium]|nr:hypothetical protein [Oscillospiraceae bacterium]
MAEFDTNLNIQTIIGLFFLALSLVLAALGFLLWRFEFLDGKSFFFSRTLGAIFLIGSGILAFTTVLLLIYVRATMG